MLFFDHPRHRGLLLLLLVIFLVFSAAAWEMDHKIAGDRSMIIICPGCVPELDEASHGKLLKHTTITNKFPSPPLDGMTAASASAIGRTCNAMWRPAGDGSSAFMVAAACIHETSLSDPGVEMIPQPVGGHESHINCSLLSSSGDRPEAPPSPAAAAGKSHLNIATALSELNSDNDLQIQASVADRLISLMIMVIMAIGGHRANERRKRACSSAAVLTMLLVAAAFAESAMAARPLPAAAGTSGGHDEASASTTPGMTLNDAAAGHSSCTTDPNTQEPVRCIHH